MTVYWWLGPQTNGVTLRAGVERLHRVSKCLGNGSNLRRVALQATALPLSYRDACRSFLALTGRTRLMLHMAHLHSLIATCCSPLSLPVPRRTWLRGYAQPCALAGLTARGSPVELPAIATGLVSVLLIPEDNASEASATDAVSTARSRSHRPPLLRALYSRQHSAEQNELLLSCSLPH